jgi:PEGA domain-containing protein
VVTPPDSSSTTSSGQGARPRDGRATVGTAVPRGSVPRPLPPNNPPPVYVSYWPYGFGGLGFGSYYGGFYDPFYPAYGAYGGYGYPGYAYPNSSYTSGFEGSLRLKIKPRDAQVFVDGYYAGVVDDFDGVFQRLHVEAGPHRIEIRAAGFEPLVLDVRVQFDETTNLEGELQRLR